MKRVISIIILSFGIGLGVLWANRTGHQSLLLLAAVLAVGVAIYRMRAAKAEADSDRFFGDAGEETRLPGAAPSEMPVDRDPARPTTPRR